MTLNSHYRMMARYNGWANDRLLAASAKLTEAQYWADGGAFFKSVGGTLNHLIVADRVWMQRFTGVGNRVWRLDEIVWPTFPELADDRRIMDQRILAYAEGIDDAALREPVRFKRVLTDEIVEDERAPLLAHMFNHQTHHRGQIHALLTAIAGTAPELDLLYFRREEARRQGGGN